ncbi:MAG TPA: PRC-barrel domain-containing protein, partial [Thermomicrobiales bacterium]|nr:PRC-barrel domain-containing protein [Thermomicrobiales bacterium]
NEPDDEPAERDLLRGVLTTFGFGGDESTYLERRLEVGAALIAVTDDRKDALQDARRLFADHSAVYLGMARTDERLVATVEALLTTAPGLTPAGDVMIADAVAPLRHAAEADASPAVASLIGRAVIDERDAAVGDVDDVLYEAPVAPGARPVPRYLIVGAGGVLGLHRKRVAVPAALATTLEDGGVMLSVSAAAVHGAPAFAQEPFSRRDEQETHRHFGVRPYWDA